MASVWQHLRKCSGTRFSGEDFAVSSLFSCDESGDIPGEFSSFLNRCFISRVRCLLDSTSGFLVSGRWHAPPILRRNYAGRGHKMGSRDLSQAAWGAKGTPQVGSWSITRPTCTLGRRWGPCSTGSWCGCGILG